MMEKSKHLGQTIYENHCWAHDTCMLHWKISPKKKHTHFFLSSNFQQKIYSKLFIHKITKYIKYLRMNFETWKLLWNIEHRRAKTNTNSLCSSTVNVAWMSAVHLIIVVTLFSHPSSSNIAKLNIVMQGKKHEKTFISDEQTQEIVCNGSVFFTKSPCYFSFWFQFYSALYAPAFWAILIFLLFITCLNHLRLKM